MPPRTKAAKLVTLRINPEQLTEDEADFLFYLKHKNDRRYTLDQVAKEFGYEVERTPVRKAPSPICVNSPTVPASRSLRKSQPSKRIPSPAATRS